MSSRQTRGYRDVQLRTATAFAPSTNQLSNRLLRPFVEEKQEVARKAVRWFLPHTSSQLLLRRAALNLARIPVFTKYVAGAVTGKASGLIEAGRWEQT